MNEHAVRFVCETTRVLFLGMLVVPPATAQFAANLDGSDHDLPLVLTPSRLPQRLDESPSSVTIIDQAMIEASGARRLADVLRLVPGFQVGYKYNNQPTAGYQGLSDEFSRRLLLLIDGQRIFQYSRGAVDWNNLPVQLEDIVRIEVVRGPNAAAYGSNAFTAVVNLQTRSAAENTGLYSRVSGGTDGIADGFVRYGGEAGIMDYALSIASTGDRGYPHVHDDRRNNSVSWRGEMPVGTFGELTLRAGYSKGDYEAQNVSSVTAGFTRDFSVTDNFQSLQWRRAFNQDEELLLTLSHNRFHHGDRGFTSADLIPGVILRIDYDIQENRQEAELQYTRRWSQAWRAVGGVGYYQEAVRSPFYFNTDETLDNRVFRVFGHSEYRPVEPLVINAGAMLEHAWMSQRAWLFLPRVSVHLHLNDHHTVRAVYSTGSRQPSLYENQGRAVVRGVNRPLTLYRVYATGIDQGGLAPEINQACELGYHWQSSQASSIDIRLFQEHITDPIRAFFRQATDYRTVSPGNAVLDFGNDSNFAIRGMEAQVDWANSVGTRLFASYALTAIDADNTRFNVRYDKSAPCHALGLLLSQAFGNGWQASLNYDYQSGMRWYLEEPIAPYHKLDARIAKSFQLGASHATLELIGTNLVGPVSDYLPTREWDPGAFLRFSMEQ